MGLQRQRERPENQEVAGRGRGQAGRGFEPPRQVALHDVSRLKLLHKLLAEDGTIFISIDDNELANLKLLCDEIFGVNNFIDIFSWHKTYSPSNLSHRTKKCLEYVLSYAQNTNAIQRFNGLYKVNEADNPLIKTTNQVKKLIFPHTVVCSTMKDDFFFKAGVYGTKKNEVILLKDVWFRNSKFENDIELESRFIWTQDNLGNEIEKGTKIIFKGRSLAPRYDKAAYSSEVPRNLIDDEDCVGTTEQGGATLTAIFNDKKIFDYPKDVSLIEYIINFLCSPDDIILDSFAGSGTTAHAVLNLNKKDGGNRKFILVEMEDYSESITAERVRRVMRGYGEGKNATAGTGGAFDYYELGEPMFDEEKNLNENIGEEKIREYIYYTETKRHLERKRTEASKYLLDTHNATGYYFYYERDRLTTLGVDTLHIVTERAEQYVIYADVCTLSKEDMAAKNIVFKKIPRDIKRF